MTLVGTVRRNKRFLPEEFQTGQGLQKGDAILAFKRKPQLLRINQIKKHVAVLSTMHHDDNFDVEARKPEIVMYNAAKGEVDSMDQMSHAVTTKRKTNRWPMLLFHSVLNLASIAALVVWRKVNPSDKLTDEDTRVLSNITVAKELVRPQLERRQIMKNLSRHLKFTINTALHQHPTQAQVGQQKAWSVPSLPQTSGFEDHNALLYVKSSVCSTHSKKNNLSLLSRVVFVPPFKKQSVSPVKSSVCSTHSKQTICLSCQE